MPRAAAPNIVFLVFLFNALSCAFVFIKDPGSDLVEGLIQFDFVFGEALGFIAGPNNDYQIDWERVVASFRKHGPYLPFLLNAGYGFTVVFADGNADSGIGIRSGRQEAEGEVLRFDLRPVFDDAIEIAMGLDAKRPFHGLVGDLGASLSAAAGQNGAAGRGGHAGAEPGFILVFLLRRLIGFLHNRSPSVSNRYYTDGG